MPNDYGLADAEWSRDRKEPLEPEPIKWCEKCNAGIYEGDRYYTIEGIDYCHDCMLELFERLA